MPLRRPRAVRDLPALFTSTAALAVVPIAIVSQGCSAAPEPSTSGGASSSVTTQGEAPLRPTQIMRWRSPEERSASVKADAIRSQAGAHLTYYGGRVVSNIQVVQVLWGSGSYLSGVTSTAAPSIATFYQQVTNSAYLDMLTEYDTSGGAQAAQNIGRGAFTGQYTITPSISGNVSDTQIQNELASQIVAGSLPAPTHDAAGNNNTYYAIFFPHGISISQGGSNSCVAGGFCAYHGTIASVSGHGEVYYGVHPDMQAGSGCDTGCGSSPSPLGNYTSVASHEMTETITDCEVGLATTYAPPLAWYDSTNGEIGDICNAQQSTFVGTDGQTYTVQREFSDSVGACIASNPAVTPPDFSVSAAATLDVAGGSTSTAAITTAVTHGSPESVALSISGLPAGVTASLSPSTVLSGATSTLTVTATLGAVVGTYPLTITATASSGTHTTGSSLVVTKGLRNGGFESGTLGSWTASGPSETVVSTGCHGGTSCAELGSATATAGASSISQKFEVGEDKSTLSFWYKMTCPDTVSHDWAVATLTDDTTATTATILPKTCVTGAWTKVSDAVTAGHQYTLKLSSRDDDNATNPTYTLFDDVTLR